MSKVVVFLFISLSSTSLIGQNKLSDKKQEASILLNNSNSWAVGGGVSNFIMHGDLRSLGTGNLGNFWNFGAYAYVDKMFNPLLGLEFKVNYSKISGGAQYFSNIYDILYVNQTRISNNLFFKGTAYGVELNLILSFSNLYAINTRKWNASGYFGVGYHQYDSALYEKIPDGSNNLLVDSGRNSSRNSGFEASSVYISTQLGVKDKINKRVDLEFRPS
jgi:OOP family OmpA-OmpF porin